MFLFGSLFSFSYLERTKHSAFNENSPENSIKISSPLFVKNFPWFSAAKVCFSWKNSSDVCTSSWIKRRQAARLLNEEHLHNNLFGNGSPFGIILLKWFSFVFVFLTARKDFFLYIHIATHVLWLKSLRIQQFNDFMRFWYMTPASDVFHSLLLRFLRAQPVSGW